MTYCAYHANASDRFQMIFDRTPEFIRSEFNDLAVGSDFWLRHVEGICSERALSVLMGLLEDNLSDKKIDAILSDCFDREVYNEVLYNFESAETELDGWQAFEENLERNRSQWEWDEKMALYRKEH